MKDNVSYYKKDFKCWVQTLNIISILNISHNIRKELGKVQDQNIRESI